jgi:hypothetical protein
MVAVHMTVKSVCLNGLKADGGVFISGDAGGVAGVSAMAAVYFSTAGNPT